jgi:Skp family chaperone for outer membrane proteins
MRGIHSKKLLLTRFGGISIITHHWETGGVPDLPNGKEATLFTHGGIQVKKNHWITLLVGIAIALGIYTIPAVTQQQPAAQTGSLPYLVAVIDLAQVIQLHPELLQRQANFKDRVEKTDAAFRKLQDDILNKRKALETSQLKPGTPQHQQQLDEITRDMAEFEKNMKLQERNFALENSKIMYDTYKNIRETVGRYADSKGIAQVTDYRVFESNPADPSSVAEDMDQRLVWYSSKLNITKIIIAQLYQDRNMQMPAELANISLGPNGIPGAANAQGAPPVPGGQPRTATAPAPGVIPGVPMQR